MLMSLKVRELNFLQKSLVQKLCTAVNTKFSKLDVCGN